MELLQTGSLAPKWKAAALTLGVLALAPFFVAGAAASALRFALGLGALGLIVLAVVTTRKRRQSGTFETPVRVLTRSTLGPRTHIAVVEFEGRRLLLGFGDGFTQVLSASRAVRRRTPKEGSS
jgi:flagellar biogenesis protein FliO